jgi:DNA-directed RNA polymerase subunit H (RpoH/RPB5)
LSLNCHSSYQWICVTAKLYNESQWSWECIKQHLKGVWSHINLSLDLVLLHQEILNIQNSDLPIIQPSDVADQVLDALKGFITFNILRHSFWIMLRMAFLVLLILCLFPVNKENKNKDNTF